MDTSYVILSRQSGLMNETRIVANNIANANTTGYRQQGLVFSEYVHSGGRYPSTSMARAQAHSTATNPGVLTRTDGQFDFAIDGEGFFMVETQSGTRLTRAGGFSPNAEGDLVSINGGRVLDINGAPIFIPPDAASISVGNDGTLSVNGQPLAQIGVYRATSPATMSREGSVTFKVEGEVELVNESRILHGFLEGSNVNAIEQITRLIEVQRAYELGQSFLETEDERVRGAIKTLMR